MISFQTLEHTPIDTLLEAFNLAFSDYTLPLNMTKEQLEHKLKKESVRLDLSVGAFENNRLIGFILHGYGVVNASKVVYNAGTGMIPAKRGNGSTIKMYDYIWPKLRQIPADKIQLEVITTNETAKRIYEKIGFKTMRKLNCFRGSIESKNTVSNFEIRRLETPDWQKLQTFWDMEPSWQNAIAAMECLKNNVYLQGIYDNHHLVGYLIYNPGIQRIHHLAIDKAHRNRGIGSQVFHYVATNWARDISIINVDDRAREATRFITSRGLSRFVSQYEMELSL